ncbi:pH response protein PalF [Talaromyces stipitatus ATCC 10500]|uniref:pH response protein PalF n=1 Tax=Talaromyces stipitatus (strain ATCC 10500 / CBS 375.48 / QM 6759 / NRRL 1006) TaxID=441959 RepID=B8MEA7_TALSN|nr:pH response protein PalF [Talaromyces stipitatus ATCC 10500]EED16534.1 pH response protein PalF [Talaromyces stipitatus ATCC 10500]
MSAELLSGADPLSPRNGWVNKLTSRFHNRKRNISEFYVQPDDPWRAYFPGDIIKGTVILTVIKPVRITHLVVCLHGYVKVFKATVSPGEIGPDIGFVGPGRGRRAGEYMGNGLATLFEDELILCGDGRLKEGIYKFKFELQLPPYKLPSSLNFERGTISYTITATLTRPITISPTISCHRRITVLEDIDIANFPAPKPRVVSLEPVSKKSKARIKQKTAIGDQIQEPTLSTLGVQETLPPLSPAPSEISGSSRRSTSSQSFRIVHNPHRTASIRSSEARSISTSLAEKTITATAELQRSGALPGDTIPIRVIINHNRQIRSPHGIIITLYRQGRIDVHPAIPLGPSDAEGKKVYEDFIPKSRTGLSGLSLGTSRSNSVFRKDLFQTFAPVIIDPVTMSATVKTSIRIPEDAFPTITRVPGAMISFRYYVETVIDLRGKLTAQDRFLPWLNMGSGGNFSPGGNAINVPGHQTGGSAAPNWSSNILDTDAIRREKGVVAMMFEVVVGTRDSSRKLRQNTDETLSVIPDGTNTLHPAVHGMDHDVDYGDGYINGDGHYDEGDYYAEDGYYDYEEEATYWPDHPPAEDQHYGPPEERVHQPDMREPDDEKTRLRQAEAMLLPSRPPGESSSAPHARISVPTAPDIPEDDHAFDHGAFPDIQLETTAPSSAISVDTVIPGPSRNRSLGSPDCEHSDDKHELERRRLMEEASAPSSTQDGSSLTPPGPNIIPTAPILEEDEFSNLHAETGESLPSYQR